MDNYLQEQYQWSIATFGSGKCTQGLISHIIDELNKVVERPDDMEEWIDVAMLALDGALRLSRRKGREHEEVMECLWHKLAINHRRQWNKETGQHIE